MICRSGYSQTPIRLRTRLVLKITETKNASCSEAYRELWSVYLPTRYDTPMPWLPKSMPKTALPPFIWMVLQLSRVGLYRFMSTHY